MGDDFGDTAIQFLSVSELRGRLAEVRRWEGALGYNYIHRGDHIEVLSPDGLIRDRLRTTGEISEHIKHLAAGRRATAVNGAEQAMSAEVLAKDRELDELRKEVERLKTDNKVLRAKGRTVLEEREKLEWEVTHLREVLSRYHSTMNDNGSSDGFSRVKKEFAKLYHPNRLAELGTIERTVRTEIFKEFWTIIEGIEKDQKR